MGEYLKKEGIKEITRSFCPICLRVIPAKVSLINGKVIISKTCNSHGKFEAPHVWDDPYLYKKMWKISKLCDNKHNGIILDLTSRCNLRCPFCFAFGSEKELKELDINEIEDTLYRVKRCHVVLYGGEPTLRDDLPKIINNVSRLGFNPILTTNGIKLTREFIAQLKKSGLRRVLLQFDGLDSSIYKILRGRDLLVKKLDAISNLKKNRMSLDLFVMLVKGMNDNQIHKIISFASKNVDNIGTVYFSPVCFEGRMNLKADRITISEVLTRIEEQTGIKKEDFLECTEFDFYLSKIIKKFGGIKTPSFCHLICYVYVDKNKIIPLNRLIGFKKLSARFKKVLKSPEFPYLKLASLLLDIFGVIIKKGNSMIERDILFNFFIPTLTKNFIGDRFSKIFRIDVFVYQDRYNADFRMLEKCNLFAKMPNGELDSFCKRNILQEIR